MNIKTKTRLQVCWGIFLRKNPGFNGTHRTPLVYCDTKETADKIMNDVKFIHYNSKYHLKKRFVENFIPFLLIPKIFQLIRCMNLL